MSVFYKLMITIFLAKMISYESILTSVHFDNYLPFKNNTSIMQQRSLKISENLPTIYASVGFFPFSSDIVESIYDESAYDNELNFLSTPKSFKSIIDNKVDIAIASDTHKVQRELLESLSDEIISVPIARDALVFYVNSSANIDSLSIDDIRDIYSGKFSSWSALGGNDKSIFLSQLEKDIGGSEEIFARVVSDTSVKRNTEFIAYDMKNIIDLASWNDGGIGYAFNQFYSKMYNRENLKLVSIDGVYPSFENISSGEYPIMCNVYFTYRKSNTNENILNILKWIKSEEGRRLIIKCGLQPIDD